MTFAEADPVAPRAVLRRIERLALAWAAVGLIGSVVVADVGFGAILTLGSAVAILAFRGLGRVVSRLTGGTIERPASTLGVVLRFALLALLPLLTLWLDSRQFLAFLLGFSAIPMALMTEAVLQLLRTLRTE